MPACAGRSSKPVAYGRPTSSEPRTLPTTFASAPKTASRRAAATTWRSPSTSTQTYSASGLTVAATFAGIVQGVVVQITSASPGASVKRKRTYSEGSTMSR